MNYEMYKELCEDLKIPCAETDAVHEGHLKIARALCDRIVDLEDKVRGLEIQHRRIG